jgi:hypothetical protein
LEDSEQRDDGAKKSIGEPEEEEESSLTATNSLEVEKIGRVRDVTI